MNEVIERIDLIVSVQGSRRISLENLIFLFDKYELKEEERQQVMEHCRQEHITVYEELPASEREPKAEKPAELPKKKSFFSRLFGG